jgi:hypothetical protein
MKAQLLVDHLYLKTTCTFLYWLHAEHGDSIYKWPVNGGLLIRKGLVASL